MRNRVNANFILFCSSFLVALLGAEVALRSIYDTPPGPSVNNHTRLFVQHDPLLGWAKIPNADDMHVTAEYSIRETMNSKGIRGPEYSYAKQEGEYRTLVLGDSFAEGYTVDFDELFSETLKSRMNNKGQDKRHEVINAGTGGYSTDQELLYFIHEGKKYNPDLTVLMFYDNDVWANTQPKYGRGYKPLFQEVDGSLTLTNVPVPQPDAAPAERASYLYSLISNNSEDILKKIVTSVISSANARSTSVPDMYRVYEKNPAEDIRKAWSITEKLIEKLKHETAAAGSELVVFYVPKREGIYDERWSEMKRYYGMSDADWDITLVRDRIRDICDRHQIKFIDPLQIFRDEANHLRAKAKRLYFQKDGHWTAEGHELAGNVLAEYVESAVLQKKRSQDLMLARNQSRLD